MMKRLAEEKNIHIVKRLTAILVAVVFVFGMMYIPAEIYAVEPDASGADSQAAETVDATEAAGTEGEQAAGEDVAAPETDASTEELQKTEAEEPAPEAKDAATVEVIEELNDALTVDLDRLDEKEYDGFIYKLEDDVTKKEVKEMKSAIDDLDESKGQEVKEVVSNELYTADSIETIAEVATPEQIEYIEPDYIVRAMGTNDEYYDDFGWYLEMINAPYVWGKNMFGDGITVAVLDSGVYMGHEEFTTDTFTEPFNAFNGSSDVTDDFWHGTAVTGMIAASYNNGKGLTGVMPGTTIMPVKVLDEKGESTTSVIIAGINYAADKGASVINLSLGTPGNDVSLEEACNAAAAKGVILVAASGNEAQISINGVVNPIEYPAAYDTVVSVGSVNESGAWSRFSTYNNKVAVTAPGQDILMLNIPSSGYRYKVYSGTSFSAPQVSAMAAMIKQIDPKINHEGFNSVIAGSSEDKGVPGYDEYYGYGLMNLENAYRHMKEKDITVYDVSLSASAFTYDGTVKTPSITVKQAGKTLSSDYYKTTYSEGRTAIGTYNVTVEGLNGYTGSKTVSFKINPIGDISKCAVSLSSKSYTYDGETKTPSVIVNNAGKTVSSSYYQTAYSSGRTAIGAYEVTVSGISGYVGTKVLSFNIVPPLVKGIKAPKKAKKKLTVKWAAMSKKQKKKYKNAITGYQVRVSTSSSFANAKYASVKGIAKTSKTVSGLKKKTTYYVQYRSYKTVGGATYYSNWSSVKKAKTK